MLRLIDVRNMQLFRVLGCALKNAAERICMYEQVQSALYLRDRRQGICMYATIPAGEGFLREHLQCAALRLRRTNARVIDQPPAASYL